MIPPFTLDLGVLQVAVFAFMLGVRLLAVCTQFNQCDLHLITKSIPSFGKMQSCKLKSTVTKTMKRMIYTPKQRRGGVYYKVRGERNVAKWRQGNNLSIFVISKNYISVLFLCMSCSFWYRKLLYY